MTLEKEEIRERKIEKKEKLINEIMIREKYFIKERKKESGK